MDLQLSNQRVLITGASRGIGRACALAFAREGAQPVLAARNPERLQDAAAAIEAETGIRPEIASADLSHGDAVRRLAEQVGEIDILVNNAGAIPAGDLQQVDDARWRAAWDLKVHAYIELVRRYLPDMERRGSGVIVNIIGMAGVANRYSYVCGSSANAALIAFTNSVGAAAPRHGVRVFGINPSATLTDRMRERFTDEQALQRAAEKLPFGRFMTPEEVAYMVVCGCSPHAAYLSGTVIDLDGGRLYADPD